MDDPARERRSRTRFPFEDTNTTSCYTVAGSQASCDQPHRNLRLSNCNVRSINAYWRCFPQTEIGEDPIAIRDYAQAAEELGYRHLLIYDHVLGASTVNRPDWRGPYTSDTLFHEPFVLFGYLAGLTQRIELVTGVIILPQRQTALVAKQAAEIDVLSGGRLRLGVGIGWNEVEYQALGEDFHNRGARMEEQIDVLRALWTQPVVSFAGRWHQIEAAGIKPLPIQRPIPIWIGATGRCGDRARRPDQRWLVSRSARRMIRRARCWIGWARLWLRLVAPPMRWALSHA